MATYRSGEGFLEIPHAAVYVLLTANIVAYGLCLNQSAGPAIALDVLYRNGAMYSLVLGRHEYWRLVAYGFLHFNLVHLVSNMLCLVLWGGHLEKRVGPAYFLLIYACALVVGALVGHLIHTTPYLTVGASGATSGILGALLCLWLLGKLDVPASFFVLNIGLNVVIALNARVDWGVHLGGLAAGLIACALLDLVEKANTIVLRCKFPEFVKTNLFVLACAFAVVLWGSRVASIGWVALVVWVTACLVVVKMIDIVLSRLKGLAIIAVMLAIANAAAVLLAAYVFAPQFGSVCAAPSPVATVTLEAVLNVTCSRPTLAAAAVAVLVLVLTALLYSQDIHRGVSDVGFVATSLRAARKRHQGI